MDELTPAELSRLISFRGYGTLDAAYWFVSIEEGMDVAALGGPLAQLKLRSGRR